MAAWSKAEKNLADIRRVESICDAKTADLKRVLANALPDFALYGKIFQVVDPKAVTVSEATRRNTDFARAVEQNFIRRAKECAAIKSDVKLASATEENKFSMARQWAQQQGLNFDFD